MSYGVKNGLAEEEEEKMQRTKYELCIVRIYCINECRLFFIIQTKCLVPDTK